jgi:hypothetical protein
VAFTSASRTWAALVVSGTIWGSKCFVQTPLQVVDDDVMEVVDVILIGVNGWGIHPLREATIVIIVRELENSPKKVNKPSMVDEQISFP